jgi:hypothetical protein
MTPSVQPKMSTEAQNMKMGPDARGTAENMYESAKHENGTGRPRYSIVTAENESGRAKLENGTRRPRNHRKRVRERKTLKWTRCPQYRRK